MIEVDYGTTKPKALDIAISKATLKLFIFNGMASLSEGYHISIPILTNFWKTLRTSLGKSMTNELKAN